jgi:hypothetical protein
MRMPAAGIIMESPGTGGFFMLTSRMRPFAAVAACRESAGMGGPLNEEEAHVIQGVLDLSNKTGSKAMTTLDKVFERLNL